MTVFEADKLKNAIVRGYMDRDDYPPYAITPWDDRNRYHAYVFKIIDEFITEGPNIE